MVKTNNRWNRLYNRIFDFYDVTERGEIISLRSGELLSMGRPNKKGYIRKNFHIDRKNGKPVTVFIHRLVAYKFHKNNNPKKLNTVDHINKDKSNNSIDNLQWLSHIDNVKKG